MRGICLFALGVLAAASAQGASVTPLAAGLGNGMGSAYHPTQNKLFFTECATGELSRFDPGNNTVAVIHTGFVCPTGVAMWPNQTFGYVTTRDGNLWKASTGSNTHTLVASGLGVPMQVALDTSNGIAYTIDAASGTLWKVSVWGGPKVAIATGLTTGYGLLMSPDFKTAYLSEPTRVVRLDLQSGILTNVVTGLSFAQQLEWANDDRSALYVTDRGGGSKVLRVDLTVTPATTTLVANVPPNVASVTRGVDPGALYVITDAYLSRINLMGGAALGPVITRVGFIPSTEIDAASGLATTQPGYFFYVKNASFGGSPHLYLNFPGIRNAGAAYYRVFLDGSATPQKASWTNYKWNVSSFALETVVPDASGYYAVPGAAEIWAIPDMGFVLDTLPLTNAKHTVTVKLYTAAKALLPDSGTVSLLVDNVPPVATLTQISHDGSKLDECALISSGSPTLEFTFSAYDPQGHLFSYALSDAWGHGKSAGIVEDHYLGVHDASPTWTGVDPKVVSYTLSCTTCAHSFHLDAWSNTTNGFSLIHHSTDLDHVAIYLPGGVCSL